MHETFLFAHSMGFSWNPFSKVNEKKSKDKLPLTVVTFGKKVISTDGNNAANVKYWNNSIETSRYTIYNFLFFNLFEQFCHFGMCNTF